MFRRFFFCDTGLKTDRSEMGRSHDDPCERWRLLCWAILCTLVWAHLPHSVLSCALFVLFTVFFSLIVSLATRDHQGPNEMLKGAFHLALVTGLISAVDTVTCQPVILRYEFLMKKLILKEYELWRSWCTNTYVTLASITIISCVIRGLHKRLGL